MSIRKLGLWALLLILGVGLWWLLPGTPHETKGGTNINAADKALEDLYQVLEADYPEVYDRLSDKGPKVYTIPGLTQTASLLAEGQDEGEEATAPDMTPQGMAFVEDYLLISAYSKSYTYHSVLWVLDRKTGDYLKTVVLPTTSHVGGLAYDSKHGRLWVTTTDQESASKISALALEDLVADDFQKTGQPIPFEEEFDLKSIEKSSYMTYYDGALFVGYFDKDDLGHVGYFPLDEKGLPAEDAKAVYDTPKKVQGLAIWKDQLVFSQSYGNKDSQLLFFENPGLDKWVHFKEENKQDSLTTPAYMQQILSDGESLYLLFESSATQYRLNPTVESIDRIIKIEK